MAISPTLLLVLSLVGCGQDKSGSSSGSSAPAAAAGEHPSLILVTMDTTRADVIGAYGEDDAAPTPTINELAAHGVRFNRAYATVPLTTPAHSSMMSGLYPPRHGVHTNGDAILPDSVTTLAEVLSGNGYQTAASVAAFVTTRIWNLDQGFSEYFDSVGAPGKERGRWGQERPANEVVDDALAWLAKTDRSKPFFLWVHFYDPHHPYNPPPEWKAKLPNRPYVGEVAFMDEQIGRLKQAVDTLAPKEGVAWIATADHGEALRDEHGETTHGVFLFEGTTHVPFIVRPATPLVETSVVTNVAVSGVDVMPTGLGLTGFPVPADLDGHDLSPFARGQTVDRGGVYLESYTVTQRFGYHPEIAAVEGSLKLMNTPSPRLYDVVADPAEATNLVDQRPDDVARLKKVTEAVEARAVASEASNLSPEAVEQLAALGYMGAGSGLDTKQRSTVDAKDRLDTIAGLEKAMTLAREPERMAEAEALYRDILKRETQIAEARLGLSRLLMRGGRLDEAEQVLRDALALEPTSTILHLNLATVLGRKQDGEGALKEFEAILAIVPTDDGGREREALQRGEAWLAEDPSNLNMQGYVGVLLLGFEETARAEPLLRAAASDGVPRERVYEGLSRIETTKGNLDLASEYLQQELNAFPQNPYARMVLARLYMNQKRWDDAAAEAGFVAERSPDNQEAVLMAAQAIFNTGDYDLAASTLAPAFAKWPNNPDIVMLQANILAKQGDMVEGEKLYKKAKVLDRGRKAAKNQQR